MRNRLVALAIGLVAVPAAAANAGAPSGHRTVLVRIATTGEIAKLGPGKIGVGHLTCMVPAKQAASVGRFVIGDPVTISCANDRLTNVKYQPERATAQTNAVIAKPSLPAPSGGPTTTGFDARSFVISFGSISSSGAGQSATRVSATPNGLVVEGIATNQATGAITWFDQSGITVGNLSCSLSPFASLGSFVYSNLVNTTHLADGQQVTIACSTATDSLVAISSWH
jgi:hypothetical protein